MHVLAQLWLPTQDHANKVGQHSSRQHGVTEQSREDAKGWGCAGGAWDMGGGSWVRMKKKTQFTCVKRPSKISSQTNFKAKPNPSLFVPTVSFVLT